MKIEKKILDACCGGRMMWFNKKHPNAIYIDKRTFEGTLSDGRSFAVTPDKLMDFRDLRFNDKSFKLVVFDPPHLSSLKETAWMAQKYGILSEETWKEDLKKGFDECWRVLADDGVLIFKWSEAESRKKSSKTVRQVLEVIGQQPLFGHPTGKSGKTMWMCFMKLSPNK